MKNNTTLQVFISLFLACLVGAFSNPFLIELYGLVGELFLNALTLIIIPLVASSLILGASQMGEGQSVGRLGGKTFGFFFLVSFLAALVGYSVMQLMTPGAFVTDLALASNISVEPPASGFLQLKQFLLSLLPSNILATAAQGQMIGLILFCLLFGYFMMKVNKELSRIMVSFWEALFQIMMKMTHFFMKFLPLGVFALVAKVVATSGWGAFHSVTGFFLAVLIAIAIYSCLILPLLLKMIGRINPLIYYGAISPALIMAFSTSSSAATLPITIDCIEKRAGISNRICSFTAPLGTTLCLSGTALYQCMVVFFVAQAYDIALPMGSQILIVAMSVIASFGMAGIPSASLIAIVMILQTMNLPVEGIALVVAVERILDMFRTATNVLGNSCCAALVASSEGELCNQLEPSEGVST